MQVPDVLRKELAGVCKACFSTNPAHRHAHVVAQYRKQFVNELNPEAPAFPRTLGELSGEIHEILLLIRIKKPSVEQPWSELL